MKFTCFGLGDREYFDSYNKFSKFLNKKMLRHGANQFCELGEGDSSGNIDEDFLEWKDKLFDSLIVESGGKVHNRRKNGIKRAKK